MVARVYMKEMGALGQFPCAGSYAEVVTPGVVRRGDPIRFERVQPRKGALAATIDMMTAARAYEANLKSLQVFRNMTEQSLSLLKGN